MVVDNNEAVSTPIHTTVINDNSTTTCMDGSYIRRNEQNSNTVTTNSDDYDNSFLDERDHNNDKAALHGVKANINGTFFRNAWRLIRIVTYHHPLYMMVTEFVFVLSLTCLLLTVLPVPESYAALSEPVPRPLSLGIILPFLGLSIAIQVMYAVITLYYLPNYRNHDEKFVKEKQKKKKKYQQQKFKWTTEVKKRSIPLLFLVAQAYNIAGFFTMIIPSLMYMALVSNPPNCVDFPQLFGQAMKYIIVVSIMKALLYFYTDACTLLWRQVLTSHLQTLYTKRGKAYYQLLLLFPSNEKATTNVDGIDNPDQRLTQEILYWCTNLSLLLQTVAISIFDIIWYTMQTWIITGWPGPTIIFGYFVLSTIVTQVFARRVPTLLALADEAEGDFRILHTTLLQQAEATAMMSGGHPEQLALNESLNLLLRRRWRYTRRQAFLQFDIFVWQYTGSIMNYVTIAIAVCSGLYINLEPNELSSLISRGSSFAISMMYGFTQLLSATVTLAELAGHTYRVIELVDSLSDVEEIATQWSRDENYDENYNENETTANDNNKNDDDDDEHENSNNGNVSRRRRRSNNNNNTQLHRIKLELTMDDISTTTSNNIATNPESSIRLLTTLRLCVSVPTNPNVPPVLLRTAGDGDNNTNNNNNNNSSSNSSGDGTTFLVQSFRGDVPLLNNITIDVKPKGKVLIRGPPGVGKSSILRTVCHLWPMARQSSDSEGNHEETGCESASPVSSVISCISPIWDHSSLSSSSWSSSSSATTAAAVAATVKRETHEKGGKGSSSDTALVYLALPQAAPFRIGMQTSLFEQLTYPLIVSNRDTTIRRKVKEALTIVGLPQILQKANGLNTKHSHQKWTTMMSPGQRQLFACARVFVHLPALVLLDEATSSMPASDEERIYKALAEKGVAYVSVGHRDSLIVHHEQIVDCAAMPDDAETDMLL